MTFDADLAHRFENPGPGEAVLLAVVSAGLRKVKEQHQMPKSLFDKIWEAHEVASNLIYIDLQLVHEVTSPQAFDGLRLAGRPVRRPDRTVATADHNVPTTARRRPRGSRTCSAAPRSRRWSATAPSSASRLLAGPEHQGIVHVIGPELGLTQPGMTIVCGDSHTATHGAFGALAFGIGTSEVEHVLATQSLVQSSPRRCGSATRASSAGRDGQGPDPATIGQIAADGGTGYVVESRARPSSSRWRTG